MESWKRAAHRDEACGFIRRCHRSAKADCCRMHSVRPAMGMAPELHVEQRLQQSCVLGLRTARGRNICLHFPMSLSCRAVSHQLLPPAGWRLMINPTTMSKTRQDFSWRTSVQTPQSQHFPQRSLGSLRTREGLPRPSTTLCSPSLALTTCQEQHKP